MIIINIVFLLSFIFFSVLLNFLLTMFFISRQTKGMRTLLWTTQVLLSLLLFFIVARERYSAIDGSLLTSHQATATMMVVVIICAFLYNVNVWVTSSMVDFVNRRLDDDLEIIDMDVKYERVNNFLVDVRNATPGEYHVQEDGHLVSKM